MWSTIPLPSNLCQAKGNDPFKAYPSRNYRTPPKTNMAGWKIHHLKNNFLWKMVTFHCQPCFCFRGGGAWGPENRKCRKRKRNNRGYVGFTTKLWPTKQLPAGISIKDVSALAFGSAAGGVASSFSKLWTGFGMLAWQVKSQKRHRRNTNQQTTWHDHALLSPSLGFAPGTLFGSVLALHFSAL